MFFLLIAFGVFFVVTSPADAAHFVKRAGENMGQWFETGARSIAKFLEALV